MTQVDGEEESTIAQRPRYDKVECVDLDTATLRRLERNDPGIAGLRITPENWIKGAGRVLGENKSLQKIDIIADDSEDGIWLEEVFTGLSRNRNLESFTLSRDFLRDNPDDEYESDRKCNCRILAPFFEYNCNLLNIELSELNFSHASHYLLSALAKCKDSRLESIALCDIHVNDKQMATIIRSLSGMKFLQDIIITLIGFDGDHTCRELSKLLESQSTKIKLLHLDWDAVLLDPEDRILTIAEGLMVNSTVKKLALPLYHIQSSSFAVWNVISQVFSRPMSSIEALNLESSVFGNDDLTHLSDALANNKTLKELNISGNGGEITLAGWRHLFRCLENDNFSLQVLDISGCNMNDDWITSIGLSLSSNTSLKKLDMSDNEEISIVGWVRFFGNLLHITSCSSLEFVDLRGTGGEEDGDIEGAMETLEADIWKALCSRSRAEDIFASNHALHTILIDGICDLEEETYKLLELNAIEDKGEVARLKTIKYHFEDYDMTGKHRMFADLPDTVLPNALEWIGRGSNRDGFSLLYTVCNFFPTLVEVRKTDDIPLHKRMKKEG